MKKQILAGVLALAIPSVALADDVCSSICKLAETVMEKRQSNVSIKVVMEVVEGVENQRAKDLTERMVLDAYKYPKMRVDENKKEQVTEFGNKWYVICVESRRQQ